MTKFVNATSSSTGWNLETILLSLNWGIFADVHPRLTVSTMLGGATTQWCGSRL